MRFDSGRPKYFLIIYLLIFIWLPLSSGQVRLAAARNRSITFYRTTTTSPKSLTSKVSDTEKFENPSLTLQARTGQFFVYAFSYRDFQKNFADQTNSAKDRHGLRTAIDSTQTKYDYTAAIHGRPDLPYWLNLANTPLDEDQNLNRAFLYGTPEKDESVDDVMILARNLATNDVLQKLIRVQVQNDKRYSSPVRQIAELWVENYDAWELLSSASATSSWSSDLSNIKLSNETRADEEPGEDSLLDELRYAISRAFRGRGVRPYIRDLKPATQVGARISPSKSAKAGFVVYVATSNGFPLGLQHLSLGLTSHPDKCNRTEIIPPDVYFSPLFHINWCRFRLYNVTTPNPNDATLLVNGQHIRGATGGLSSFDDAAPIAEFESNQKVRHYDPVPRQRDYSWEWVMVAVVPLAILLVLVLILSAVFFGCREGQHWRDYKTPRDQLNEYVNLRRSQQRLRLLSQQRQSIDILDATGEPSAPQPPPRRPAAPSSPTLSVGKQTVAQAAAVKGSNIALYKDTDSFDECDQLLDEPRGGTYPKHYHESKGHAQPGQRRTSYDDQRMLITRDSSV